MTQPFETTLPRINYILCQPKIRPLLYFEWVNCALNYKRHFVSKNFLRKPFLQLYRFNAFLSDSKVFFLSKTDNGWKRREKDAKRLRTRVFLRESLLNTSKNIYITKNLLLNK